MNTVTESISEGPEDGAEIIFLDADGNQHRIVYDIKEDHLGLGSGWFLHEDDSFQKNPPKLEGRNRILADRMWRSPEKRKQFETAKRDGMDMYGKAMQRNGRYYLRKRVRKGNPEQDALYDAAEWLVGNGYATWMTGDMAPGITLTGKPGV